MGTETDHQLEEFFMLCLMMFGEPMQYQGRTAAAYFMALSDFLRLSTRGKIFTQCVTQCFGPKKPWKVNQLHQRYAKWYRRRQRKTHG